MVTRQDAPSRSLYPPTAWADELCALRNPDLAEDVAGPPRLVLSYFPDQADAWAVDLDEVEDDLERGMWLRLGRPHPRGTRFLLSSEQYQLEIVSRPAKSDASRELAVVSWVRLTDAGRLPRRAGRFSRPVSFEEVYDEYECDLRVLKRELDLPELRQAALRAAAKELAGVPHAAELSEHAELHRQTRRRYGALRALLKLLQLRASLGAISTEGIVVAPHDEDGTRPTGYLYVRVEGRTEAFDDAYVEVVSSGRPLRTRVRDTSSHILTLDAPSRGEWSPGDRVTVTTVPRFAMRQHDVALERFLRGEVEGNWDDLAALLCRPRQLRLTSSPLPPRFFCDEDPEERPLNAEQRKAVAGALATPHAFFIQGPPGTGKTTVICELARQLCARGERVLMLAPTHVAVDEVLRRVGHKPGIWALRLAWDEECVDDDLRRFMPGRVGAEFVTSLRRPGNSSDRRWDARHESLRAEQAAVQRLQTALREVERASSAVADAEKVERSNRQRLADTLERHRQSIARHEMQTLAAAKIHHGAMEAKERALGEDLAAHAEFERHRESVERILTLARSITQASQRLHRNNLARIAAAGAEADQRQRWVRGCRQIDEQLFMLDGMLHDARLTAEQTWGQLQEARAALDSVPPRGAFGRMADTLGLGLAARRRSAWSRAQAVWVDADRRWRQLTEQRQALLGQRQHLDTDRRAAAARLAAAEDELAAADVTYQRATQSWSTVTPMFGGVATPDPADVDAAADRVAAVLVEPAETHVLPSGLLPGPFRLAHQRVIETAAQRLRYQREVLLTEQALAAARQARADTKDAGLAEIHGLEQALSQTRHELASRAADLASATEERAEAMTALGYRDVPSSSDLQVRREQLDRQVRVLPRYGALERRWFDLIGDQTDQQLAEEVGDALLRSVNLVCATTTGIAGRSAELAGHVDFDTLIVDEASRVIDSEFLIGAIRARRWILVGDERQLPPYVDHGDEHHLHAMAALYRHERGDADTLAQSVKQLAEIWQEDGEQRQFRVDEVLAIAERLAGEGAWTEDYREIFVDAHRHHRQGDADRKLLGTMRDHLVRSLFERTVQVCEPTMRQRLTTQRRMIAPLAEIVKQPIYGGCYETPPAEELARCKVTPLTTATFDRPVVFLDTSLRPEAAERLVNHGFVNNLECDLVVQACLRYEQDLRAAPENDPVTVSVLCFYQAQARELRERLGAPMYRRFRRLRFDRVAAIDKIQGQESDLVFLTFSRTNPYPGKTFGIWLQDVRRLNVACTRAHRALVLIGHSQMLGRLRWSDKAQEFYRNLLELFEQPGDDYLLIRDFRDLLR